MFDNKKIATGFEDDELVEKINQKINKCIPLEPIKITVHGDFLLEYPSDRNLHTHDDDKLDSCLGVHKFCNSFMYHALATETHDVIICRGCFLRVRFSKEVVTYGDLRKEFAQYTTQA